MKRLIAVITLLALVLCGCGTTVVESAEGTFNTQVDQKQIISERSPANNETVSLVNEEVEDFLDGHVFGKGLVVADTRTEDLGVSVPVTLSWECSKANTGYTVIYTTQQDFSDAVEIDTTETSVELEDLFVATTYYWQVVTHMEKGDNYSTVFAFTTKETPRLLSIDGAYNARDLGGYLTEDGKYRVKQGLIFRGSKLDSITEEGIDKFLNVYNITTDFDLRDETDSGFTGESSPVTGVENYINIGGVGYSASISSNIEEMKQEILVFIEQENYPIYAHCSAGRDRCGTLMFHIGALLGLSKETLVADYEMTYLSAKSYAKGDQKGHDWIATFLSAFECLEGETYKEKAENFWLKNGITQEQIDTLRSIMLDPVE